MTRSISYRASRKGPYPRGTVTAQEFRGHDALPWAPERCDNDAMTGSRGDDRQDQSHQVVVDAEGTVTPACDGSFLSPQEFFREFTARPDVDRVMTALAQMDQHERTDEQRDGIEPAPARAPRWPKSNPS